MAQDRPMRQAVSSLWSGLSDPVRQARSSLRLGCDKLVTGLSQTRSQADSRTCMTGSRLDVTMVGLIINISIMERYIKINDL